ncbi:MAG: hypothetical protein AMXMBFR36_22950 [Acidobacteriota bacterium]
MRRLPTAAALLGSILAASAFAQEEAPILPVDQIRAGQRGYGETVFAGGVRERFEVEILGVLREMQPGTDAVMARLTGRGLEKTGVIAGMSGSPVWIDGKLVGAIAFGWPFATEAIGGITPIEQMRAIPRAGPWPAAVRTASVTLEEVAARRLPTDLLERAAERLVAATGIGARGAVTWSIAGLAGSGLDRLRAALPALAPTAAGRSAPIGAGDDGAVELVAGSSVAAVFVDGDLRLAATGTVTEVSGRRVLAFGHPVAGLGEVSLPMAPADVVTVLPSLYSSFKLANSGAIVGEFTRDHAAGAVGTLGAVPRTVPFELEIAGPSPRTYALRLARVPQFVPLLAAIGALGALDVAASSGGTEGVDLELAADLGAHGRLELAQSFDGVGAGTSAVLWMYAVLDFLSGTELAEVQIESISAKLTPWAQPRVATLVGAHPARSRLEPGETLDLFVDLRAFRGETERRRLSLVVPPDLPAGRYTLLVGDGTSVDAARLGLAPAAPVTFEQAMELLDSLGTSREIAVLGVLAGRGLSVAGEVLPRLPSSARQIWAAGGGGGARPLRLAVAQLERFPQDAPISGIVRLDVELARPTPSTGDAAEAEDGAEPAAGETPQGSTGEGRAPSAPAAQEGPKGSREDR